MALDNVVIANKNPRLSAFMLDPPCGNSLLMQPLIAYYFSGRLILSITTCYDLQHGIFSLTSVAKASLIVFGRLLSEYRV